MGRKSISHLFIGKKSGGIKILEKIPKISNEREQVKCECLTCHKIFIASFHNVYRGHYKSCGCLQHALSNQSPKWKGEGEISKSVFYSYVRNAKKRKLKFAVSQNYIWNLFLQQDRKCALSGVKLTFPLHRKDYQATASLDRIDPMKGYVENNLQWITKEINYMKQSMNNMEFLTKIKLIHSYNNE